MFIAIRNRLFCHAFSLVIVLTMSMHAAVGEVNAPLSATSGDGDVAQRIDFNIPSQPLSSALERYGEVSGREILYNSNLVSGSRSNSVKGSLTPDQALDVLLAGTGLSARYIADKSLILKAAKDSASQQAMTASASTAFQQYYRRIQLSLRDALCSSREERPGRYRIAARLWIGSAGNVVSYERLASTGSDRLDKDVDLRLGNLRIGEAPPSGFDQPVTIVILPQAPNVTMGCDDGVGSRTRKADR